MGGRVIGGDPPAPGVDGPDYVQVADDPTGARILGQSALLDLLPGVIGAYANLSMPARYLIPREPPR